MQRFSVIFFCFYVLIILTSLRQEFVLTTGYSVRLGVSIHGIGFFLTRKMCSVNLVAIIRGSASVCLRSSTIFSLLARPTSVLRLLPPVVLCVVANVDDGTVDVLVVDIVVDVDVDIDVVVVVVVIVVVVVVVTSSFSSGSFVVSSSFVGVSFFGTAATPTRRISLIVSSMSTETDRRLSSSLDDCGDFFEVVG